MIEVAEKISTQGTWVLRGHSNSTSEFVKVKASGRVRPRTAKNHAAAVYSYVRAIRSAGKSKVSVAEVASALNLSERETRKILASMSDKGVKPR